MEIREIGNATVEQKRQELMYQLRREGVQARQGKHQFQRDQSPQGRPMNRLPASISLGRPMHRLQRIGDQRLSQKIGHKELNQMEERRDLRVRHMD